MSATVRTGDTNNKHNKALNVAIRTNQFEEVRNLLEHNLDNIDINGYNDGYCTHTPLWEVCAFNDVRIVALLLEYGADPNHGTKVVEMNGERYYSNGNSPMWHSCQRHVSKDVLSHLLRYGADPNTVYPLRNSSPLHYVCCDVQYDKIELLLRHGANVNQPNRDGESPLLEIVSGSFASPFDDNHLSCLRLMLEDGADPNVISRRGTTPLIQLIFHVEGECRLDAIRLMIRHGADITIPIPQSCPLYIYIPNYIKGDTIMHALVRLRDVVAIRVMTECQAITMFWWLQNDNGDTVYDLAAKLEYVPIIEYFDMKWLQWRQQCYANLLQAWIQKRCMKTMTMTHHIDVAARSDIDAKMPLGAEEERDGIFAIAPLPTKSREDPNADRKDARGSFEAEKKRKICDNVSKTG